MSKVGELTINDFDLQGEYGSEGATLEQIGENHFQMTLGTAPNQPTWGNKPQFIIKGNARGNGLRLDVVGPGEDGGQFPMTEYFYSWSYDNEMWHPIQLETDDPKRNTFIFPEFEEDQVYFGHQIPFSPEKIEKLAQEWEENPLVTTHLLGQSLNGKNIYRFTITDPENHISQEPLWTHYFIQVHPGEHNAQWRMLGMINWLLSDEGATFRQKHICHFVLMMSVDATSRGWYRVNQQGIDMNRSYFAQGAQAGEQAHEAYICQRDLEEINASDRPITTLWNMHTWQGPVEPIIYPGPEFGTQVGEWTELKDLMNQHDPKEYVKELQSAAIRNPQNLMGMPEGWNGGPKHQFGLTTVLCEGGSTLYTQESNMESGVVIIKSLADFYR